MKNSAYYEHTTYWWDDDDNEYTLKAVFYFEDGMNEIPDSEILMSLEVVDSDEQTPCITHLLTKGGDVWNYVESNISRCNSEYIGQHLDYGY